MDLKIEGTKEQSRAIRRIFQILNTIDPEQQLYWISRNYFTENKKTKQTKKITKKHLNPQKQFKFPKTSKHFLASHV